FKASTRSAGVGSAARTGGAPTSRTIRAVAPRTGTKLIFMVRDPFACVQIENLAHKFDDLTSALDGGAAGPTSLAGSLAAWFRRGGLLSTIKARRGGQFAIASRGCRRMISREGEHLARTT